MAPFSPGSTPKTPVVSQPGSGKPPPPQSGIPRGELSVGHSALASILQRSCFVLFSGGVDPCRLESSYHYGRSTGPTWELPPLCSAFLHLFGARPAGSTEGGPVPMLLPASWAKFEVLGAEGAVGGCSTGLVFQSSMPGGGMSGYLSPGCCKAKVQGVSVVGT